MAAPEQGPRAPSPLPFPTSLCHACRALRLVTGKRSTFLQCSALAQKYPPQPVRSCAAFVARDAPRP